MEVAKECKVLDKVKAMFSGEKINNTEKRSVLHVALRKTVDDKLEVDGKDVVADVHMVNMKIQHFSEQVRSGQIAGFTGKKL